MPSRPPAVPDLSLELDAPAFRALVDQAVSRLSTYVSTLPTQPSFDLDDAPASARAVRRDILDQPTPAPALLDELFERCIPKGFNTAGPGYLAYIPGGGLLSSAVADLIACAVNRYVGVWTAAPALAEIESEVVRWCARVVGYPATAGGILTSGGSLANFSAVVAARHHVVGEDLSRAVAYVSDQGHHSLTKAAILAGIRRANVRAIPSDERFRIRPDLLELAIQRDRAAGLAPFLVCGTAGTTNTGAIDDLPRLSELARHHALWFHVDAAYGGFFALTERGRRALRGIELADSITLDPHKGLFLPYGTGCLLAREPAHLRAAHSIAAEYLPAMQDGQEFVDFCELSPELSREFRGLRVWLPLHLHGVAAFRANLDEKLDLARWAADRLRETEGIELAAEPELSLLAFRLVSPGLDDAALDRLNEILLTRVNARRRVYLTATRAHGRYVPRICVLSFRTHADRLEECLAAVREEAALLA